MALSAKRPSRGDEAREKLLREVTDTKPKKKRLNLDVDEDIYRSMKARALAEDSTVAEITRRLWDQYMSK